MDNDDIYFTINGRHQFIYVFENVGTLIMGITSRASIERQAYIRLGYHYAINAAIPGVDFEFQNFTDFSQVFNFTISARATRNFYVTIIDDSIAECRYDERILFEIGVYEGGGVEYCDYNNIYIQDTNDLYFAIAGGTVPEDIGTATIGIASRGSIDQEAYIHIPYSGTYSPIPGVDFDFQGLTNSSRVFNFTISAGATRNFDVTIIDDSVTECHSNEGILFVIGVYNNGSSRVDYCENTYIYIDDNDGIYFTNPGIHRRIYEDVGTVIIGIASRARTEKKAYFSFPYAGAFPGMDYQFQNLTGSSRVFNFTISAGATMSFSMTIIDDSIAEGRNDERIYIDIGVYDDGEVGNCNRDYIYIEDNDGLRFEFSQTGYTVDEDVGTVEFCVTYTGDNLPPAIDAVFDYFYQYNYYNDDDILFEAQEFRLAVRGRICFEVTVIDDEEIESDEYYSFNVYPIDNSILDSFDDYHFRDRTHIRIRDNEAFRIGLERSSYSVLESEGAVTVCVTADRGDGSEVYSVTLSTINVTTEGVVDHEPVQQQLFVSAVNLSRQCVDIAITDDDLPEEKEFFLLTIASSFRIAGSYIRQISIHNATIIIIDDDLMCNPECVNGICRSPGVCQCYKGWIDEDCSRDVTCTYHSSVRECMCILHQRFASLLVSMECAVWTLDTVTVLLDTLASTVMKM
jgi:hypothetical protein